MIKRLLYIVTSRLNLAGPQTWWVTVYAGQNVAGPYSSPEQAQAVADQYNGVD